MNRKQRMLRNMGKTFQEEDGRAEPFFDGPIAAEVRTSVVMVERILRGLLLNEVERLRKDTNELRRFFKHFFDPTTSEEEREQFVANFQKYPPRVVIGYPKMGAEMPCFAIVLMSDEEKDGQPAGFLGKYAGQTLPDEETDEHGDAEYVGGYFDQQYTVFVYGQHPDQVAYLYQFAKLTLFAARETLEAVGLIDPRYSGGELSPEEMYLPDNVFARAVNVRLTTMMTVPRLLPFKDGRRVRITGIFREDVVVDGVPGGVKTYVPGDDDGE